MGDLIQRFEFYGGVVVLLGLEPVILNNGTTIRYMLKSIRLQINGMEYVWEQDDGVGAMDDNNNSVDSGEGAPRVVALKRATSKKNGET